MQIESILDHVLEDAIAELRRQGKAIYTFAFFYDREQKVVSVCADTAKNSAKQVRNSNKFVADYFRQSLYEKDLVAAASWSANSGRNLSLADFKFVNLAAAPITPGADNTAFFLQMIEAVRRRQEEILTLAKSPDDLLLCCSGPNDAVEFIWSDDLMAP